MGQRVWVRATINLRRLPVGAYALVNPDEPYIKECLDQSYLIRDTPDRKARRESVRLKT